MLTANDVLTLQEAKKILKVSSQTLYDMIKRKIIPAKKVGRSWRILAESIDDYLKGQTTQTKQPDENLR